MNAPRFITLTLKHKLASLSEELKRLAEHFRQLRKTPQWKTHVKGGVYAVEVVRNETTDRWHAHLHIVADGEFWSQAQLSKMWLKVTGDSDIVDIRAVPDANRAAKYIAAYVAKPLDMFTWSDRSLCEFASALHGKRMLHTFGTSHGTGVEVIKQPAEQKFSEPLGPVDRLVRWSKAGHKASQIAIEIAERMGPQWKAALGRPRIEWFQETAPVQDWEQLFLISVMRELEPHDFSGVQTPPPSYCDLHSNPDNGKQLHLSGVLQAVLV